MDAANSRTPGFQAQSKILQAGSKVNSLMSTPTHALCSLAGYGYCYAPLSALSFPNEGEEDHPAPAAYRNPVWPDGKQSEPAKPAVVVKPAKYTAKIYLSVE